MKNSLVKSVILFGALVLLAGNTFAGSLDGGKRKNKKAKTETSQTMEPNGNYKHTIPTSEGTKFKDSFTKPQPETINRNYKQQNQPQSNVKFKDHFTKPPKTNHSSYKHPQGL
ncbi:MAG TPA: hypothetical protein VNB90_01175 [Cytophagaceae bacterium]|nr:hypothetical protein [Cytophagaceae bacterium]